MICKYCGSQYFGDKCVSCGKIIPLVKRSTDLDILMSNRVEVKTYEQGIKEGYQKGLKEGYDNGYAEGKNSVIPPVLPKNHTKRMVLVFSILCVLMSAISGLYFNRSGYINGFTQGHEKGFVEGNQEGLQIAEDSLVQQLDQKYQLGYEQGTAEGFQSGYEKGKSEGYEKGKKDAAVVIETAAPQKGETASPIPVISGFDFPYSQKNEKVYIPVVKKIQQRLTDLGYRIIEKKGKKTQFNTITADGKYGPKTVTAVEWFQVISGLEQTGIVDIETYMRLFPDELVPETNQLEEQQESNDKPKEENQENTSAAVTDSSYPVPILPFPIINWNLTESYDTDMELQQTDIVETPQLLTVSSE